jgi:hypothetical protein
MPYTAPAPASAPPQSDPGFRLPADGASSPRPGGAFDTSPPPTARTPATNLEIERAQDGPQAETSARDMAIGSAVFVVLLVVFFFIRNAYVHHMVVQRVAPSSAGSAGWLLFLGLSFLSGAAVLAMLNAKYLAFAITAPLVLVGLVALGAALFVGRR